MSYLIAPLNYFMHWQASNYFLTLICTINIRFSKLIIIKVSTPETIVTTTKLLLNIIRNNYSTLKGQIASLGIFDQRGPS